MCAGKPASIVARVKYLTRNEFNGGLEFFQKLSEERAAAASALQSIAADVRVLREDAQRAEMALRTVRYCDAG